MDALLISFGLSCVVIYVALLVGVGRWQARQALRRAANSLGLTHIGGELLGTFEDHRVEIRLVQLGAAARIVVDSKGRIPRSIVLRSRHRSENLFGAPSVTGDRDLDARFAISGDTRLIATMFTSAVRNVIDGFGDLEIANGKVITESLPNFDINGSLRKTVALAKMLQRGEDVRDQQLIERLKTELNPSVRRALFDRILAGASGELLALAIDFAIASRERELVLRALLHTTSRHAEKLLALLRCTPETDDELRARLISSIPDSALSLPELRRWALGAGPQFRASIVRAIRSRQTSSGPGQLSIVGDAQNGEVSLAVGSGALALSDGE